MTTEPRNESVTARIDASPPLLEDLRAVLEPFAVEADRQERTTTFSSGNSVILRTNITIGQLRRARAALARVGDA